MSSTNTRHGDGQLGGGETVDGRLWLADPCLAGDHDRVEPLVELVSSVRIIGGCLPGIRDDPDSDASPACLKDRITYQRLRP